MRRQDWSQVVSAAAVIAALAELRRVLKPGGRLIVGEVAIDPDFVPSRQLRPMAEGAGLRLVRRFGPPFAYHAQFVAA